MNTHPKANFSPTKLLCTPLVVGAALLVASCATTPKPAPQTSSPSTPAAASTSAPAATAQQPAPETELQKAKSLKQEIDQFNLGPTEPQAYQKGSAALVAGEKAMGGDNVSAKRELDKAIGDFQQVLDTGLPLALKREKHIVAQAKASADAAKADQAAPDEYQKAAALAAQAATKQKAGSLGEAYTLLREAASAYQNATATAEKKRAQAQAALQQADRKIGQAKSQVQAIQKNLESALASNTGGQ